MVNSAYPFADDNRVAFYFASGGAASTLENVSPATDVYVAYAAHRHHPHRPVYYSLPPNVGDNNLFYINPNTGEVRFRASPDYEHPADANHDNVYDIVVMAQFGRQVISKVVAISIVDVNDNTPVFTSGQTASEPEHTPATNVAYTAHATDADGTSPNNSVSYSLSGTDAGQFNINATTGDVTFKTSPSYQHPTDSDSNNVYDVVVTATDGGRPSLSTSMGVTITVTDVAPSTPTDADGAANKVAEGAAAGTYTGLTASSSESGGDPVAYSISNDTSGGGFKIDATTGAVTVADPSKIDYESAPNHAYSVTVVASDGAMTSSQTFSIAVTDVAPSTPIDSNAAANTVAEGAAAGTAVGITASSADVNGPAVTYSLVGDTSNGGFTVNSSTGVVTVADGSKIDYETAPNHAYSITVAASDGTLTSSQTFAIAVTDVAPSTPVDSNAAANTVAEGAAAGTVVGITASSTDVNGPAVTYSLVGDSSNGGLQINSSTGIVTVADGSKIDYESAPNHSYSVTVAASDGILTSQQTFSIAVTDVAPSTPVDSNVVANTVAEGAAAGTAVGITASSTDVNGPAVTYSLVGDSSNGGFTVNASTGVVTVADGSKIDYETAPNHAYTVSVAASDGTLASAQIFSIAVTDVAPSTPVDSNVAANTVAEGATAGTAVGITASSTDVNGPAVTYSLTNDTSTGGFTVNSSTGVVTVADGSKIDYETAQNHAYSITVAASDGTLASAQTFSIAVTNAAPSTPVDSDATANTVVEGAAAGTTVGITASSTDPGSGPAVTYSLTDSAGGAFAINASTGVITVADPTKIDYESAPNHSYSVTVQASDGTLTSSQTFAIAVTDAPPSTPVDSDASPNQVSTNAPQGSSTGVTASSMDPNGGAVAYTLTNDDGGHFQIDPSTGVVTVGSVAPVYDSMNIANDTRTITVQAADPSGMASTADFTVVVVANTAPTANADNLTATEAGGTNNTTPGHDPQGNVVTGAGGNGEVADTDQQDPSSALRVISAGTGASAGSSDVAVTTSGTTITGSHGALTIASDGSYTYAVNQADAAVNALNPAQTLPDTFHYTIQDTGGLTSTAAINVTIHGADDAPTANPDAVSATEAGGVNNGTPGTNPSFNVIAGTGETIATGADSDPDNGDTLTVAGVAAGTTSASLATGAGTNVAGAYGTIHINADGSATYAVNNANATVNALNPNQTLTDTFSYTVTDSGGLTSTTQVTVTIHGTNDAPTAVNDTSTSPGATAATEAGGINNGTPGANGTGNVLTNDTDPDSGDTKAVQGVEAGSHPTDVVSGNVGTSVPGAYGAVTINAAGSYVYAVDNSNATVNALGVGQSLTDVFTYTMHDSGGATSTATLTVTINGANDAPTATSFTSTGNEDTNRSITLSGTDPDTGDTITSYKITSLPPTTEGTLYSDSGYSQTVSAGQTVGQTVYFKPVANYSGTGSFQYTATDNHGLTGNPGTVTVDVAPVADTATTTLGSFQPTPAFAQNNTPVTPAPEGGGYNLDTNQSSVSAIAGGYAVAYTVQDADKQYYPQEIEVQRYNLDGTTNGSPIEITNALDQGANSQQYDADPDIQKLANGGFLVTWDRSTNFNSNYTDVIGRLYNASGVATTGEFTIASGGATRYLSVPNSVVLNDGSFVTVYTSEALMSGAPGDQSTGDVYIAHTSATGIAIGSPTLVPTNNAKTQLFPSAAALADGGFLVTWTTDVSTSGLVDEELHAQRYNSAGQAVHADGTTLGAQEFSVSTDNASTQDRQVGADVAGLTNGGWVVTWDATDGTTHARTFSSTGVGGTEFTVAPSNGQTDVVALPDGGFFVSWEVVGNGTEEDIYAQRYNAAGQAVGSVIIVNNAANSQVQGDNALAVLSNSDVVSTWTEYGTGVGKSAHSIAYAIPGDGGVGTATTLTTLTTTLGDTDGSETLSYHLTGFPSGTTFNKGALVGSEWVISSSADITYLQTHPLTATVPTAGDFALTIDAQTTDTATLSTGTVTAGPSHSYTTINVGIKSAADPVFAAHDAGTFDLHLSAITASDTAHIEALPDDGQITYADGTPVKAGATLSAGQLAGLKFTPLDDGADHASNLIYSVSDGTSVDRQTLPIYVQPGSNLTLTGTADKDVLMGGAGNDTLIGNGGGNFLTGGAGADTFVFESRALADASAAAPRVDHVTDYSAAQGDTLDFTALFASTSSPSAQAANLVHVTEDASGAAASVSINVAGPNTAAHWVEIAHLDGVQVGQTVDVALDAANPHQVSHLHVDGLAHA